MAQAPAFTFTPLTPETWGDFARLFGPRGACGGCWCMLHRVPRKDWEAGKGEGNRTAMRKLVKSGVVPGLLAYAGGEAVGWCSVAPRECFPGLARSRVMQPPDERPVWSVTCFYIAKSARGRGLSVSLLNAVCDHVTAQGGRIVEGYPTEPKTAKMPPAFAWMGLAAAFRRAGFEECARRSETRPLMRRYLQPGSA